MLSKYSCWVRDATKARKCLLKLNGQARWDTLLSFHKLKMSKFQPVFQRLHCFFYAMTVLTHELHAKYLRCQALCRDTNSDLQALIAWQEKKYKRHKLM